MPLFLGEQDHSKKQQEKWNAKAAKNALSFCMPDPLWPYASKRQKVSTHAKNDQMSDSLKKAAQEKDYSKIGSLRTR